MCRYQSLTLVLFQQRKPPKVDAVAWQQETGHTPFGSISSSPGFIVASGIDDVVGKGKPTATQSSLLTEFRDKLAMMSQFDPSPPSLSLYTVRCGPQQRSVSHDAHVISHDYHVTVMCHAVFKKKNRVHCAAINSTSKLYACGFSDSSIHLWSQLPPATDHMTSHSPPPPPPPPSINSQHFEGKPRKDHALLLGHHGAVQGACFNADGRFLLSASEDCSLRLWDTLSHSALVSYRGHAYPVWDVAFRSVSSTHTDNFRHYIDRCFPIIAGAGL